MKDSYAPPQANSTMPSFVHNRVAYAFVAFLSAVFLLPAIIYSVALTLLPPDDLATGSFKFWSTLLLSGAISFSLVNWVIRCRLIGAIVVGVVISSILFVALLLALNFWPGATGAI